ncbi:MAG: 4Fe-4S dicluster domain-containing protein [Candidatus Omnitrophota bacterium]|nr:4Fe-4S dicluster domain-containing protein [Candidatus Omnitrophota bacterium]
MKKIYYDVKKCLGCRSCEIACAIVHSENRDLLAAIKSGKLALPGKKIYSVKGKNYPVSCRQCSEPKCVDACMAAALTFDAVKGVVAHDKTRCVGCWMCVMACPYGAVRPDLKGKVPVRCDMCPDEDEKPCVRACPTKAIVWREEKK